MRSSSSSSSLRQNSAGRLKEDLNRIVNQVHKISSDHNITNDSGVSFSGDSSSKAPTRQATGSSVASTITPETLASRSSTLTVESAAPRPPSISEVYKLNPTGTPPTILTQLGPSGISEQSVVSSPLAVSRASPGPFAQSPTSSQEYELEDTWASLARELKPIADVMRSGRLRTQLGQSRLSFDCVSALRLWLNAQAASTPEQHIKGSTLDAHIEIFRVLANLCIDHEQNRDVLSDLGAAALVLSIVSALLQKQSQSRSSALFSIKFLSLLRAAMGAVLNMQLEHIPTRQSLANVECLSILTQVASHPRVYTPNLWRFPQTVEMENDADALDKIKIGAMVCSWTWRIIQEVYDDAREEKDRRKQASLDDMDDEDGGETDVPAILSKHSFRAILRPLLLYTPSEALSAMSQSSQPLFSLEVDDVEQLVDADTEILLISSELMEGCAGEAQDFRSSAVAVLRTEDASEAASSHLEAEKAFGSPLDLLMTFVEKAEIPPAWQTDQQDVLPSVNDTEASAEALKTFAKVKAACARTVVAISGDDANMERLFSGSSGFIERLKAWIRSDPKERDDLVSCGMLALGNLARSDLHCLSLVRDHNLAPFLASMLSQASDIKVAHGLISLLKNLSIPAANKTVIGNLGVVDAVIPFLEKSRDMVQPLQFGTVGLLKHLCSGVPGNSVRLVGVDSSSGSSNDTNALNALVDLIKRVDDVPTKMEATRVLVNVVKSLWSAPKLGSRSLPEGVVSAARSKVVRRDVIQALAEMVRTSPKYPVLVNEGILALTLIGSERSGAELVSLSLLLEPAAAAAVAGDASDLDDEDEEVPGRAVVPAKRRSTADSVGSTSSNPLPPPNSALDMVNSVLARRDARMPPQFACNACMLVMSLCHASTSGKGRVTDSNKMDMVIDDEASTGAVGQDAIVRVAAKTRPALEQLKHQGPTEALEPAAKALQSVLRISA